MPGADSADALRELIDRYNDAWNRQDLDAIMSMHTPDIVFHNHTAGECVEGDGSATTSPASSRTGPG